MFTQNFKVIVVWVILLIKYLTFISQQCGANNSFVSQRVCGESITDLQKIMKVLKALTAKFDYIVVAIEKSKHLFEMKLEELLASLKAHEMRLKKKDSKREKGGWAGTTSNIHQESWKRKRKLEKKTLQLLGIQLRTQRINVVQTKKE